MSVALLSVILLFLPQPKLTQPQRLVAAARSQVGKTVSYDNGYRSISYPNGDVPIRTGVCSDVLIRSFRSLGIDLQKDVHDDMFAAFDRYPHLWGLKRPDGNIDHRRVPNLMTYFARKGKKVTAIARPADFQPGDIVAWNLGGGITHIGIVGDKQNATDQTPLIIHNIGSGVKEEDILFKFKIIGHYRYF